MKTSGGIRYGFFLLIIAALFAVFSCQQSDRYISFSGYAQGGVYTVKLNLNGKEGKIKASPQQIRDSVEAILKNVDMSLSGYNRKSILSRFNAGEMVRPDAIFFDIYGKAYDIYRQTSGVVDVASAPLFDVWGFGFTRDSLPSEMLLSAARAASGMDRLHSDPASLTDADGMLSSSSLLLSGGVSPKLNYNAIAQGYSCDLVADYLYSLGVKDMMVDIGEIFCDGLNPSGKPWSLGIDRPVDGNDVPGADMQGIFRAADVPCGIVTSGNYRKFYLKDGKKYSHSIDPRTGYPVGHTLLSATIVARDATTADAFATYCMVVGLEEASEFIESSPELEGCLIYDEGGVMRTWCSSGFHLEIID